MTERPSLLALALTVAGAVLIASFAFADGALRRPVWLPVLGGVALICWVSGTTAGYLARRNLSRTLFGIAVIAGVLGIRGTGGNSFVPAVICLASLIADDALALWVGLAAATTATALIAAEGILASMDRTGLATLFAWIWAAALAGYSRRQNRQARRREALLAERDAAVREDASRIALARDLHDVLAHSLGGLVVQLDAAEALLDAGQVAQAGARVSGARELAVNGLEDARRAVAALREQRAWSPVDGRTIPGSAGDQAGVTPESLHRSVEDLLRVHRMLGGDVRLESRGLARPVSPELGSALERAVQEVLSNARRHAAGEPVVLTLEWSQDRVRLTASNPTGGRGRERPGGYGLVGMRERFSALPAGGRVDARVEDGRFTLVAEAAL